MDYALSRQQGPRTKRGLATTIWALVFALLLAAPAVLAADWYASPSGAGTRDCMSAANACAGIQAAIDKADEYDTVHVLAGNYPTTSQRIRIEKEGLQLIGAHSPFAKPYATPPGAGEVAHGSADNKAANASVLQAAGGAPSSVGGIKVDGMIWVRNVKSVRIENLYFELKTSGGFFGFGGYGKEAIVATGYVNGLEIVNNYIKATAGTAGIAIGINVAGTSDSSVPATETRRGAQFVTISGNVIEPSSSAAPKRAIAMESNVGLIENNQVAAHTQDMWIQNPAANNTTPAAQRNLTFQGNWFFGRMQLYLGRASGVTAPVVVSGNHFIKPGSVFSNPASSAAAGSLGNGSEAHGLRVMSPQAAETLVSNNEFLGFSGSYRGLWVNNRNGVLIEDNLFTPDDGASEFTAVLVGNRELWNGTPAPVEMGVTLLRNTFNASAGGAQNNKAKAILFVNDNDAGETATAGALQVGDGTLVNANEFADGIGWYIALDDRTCNGQNHNSGTCNGTASYVIGEGIAYSGASSTSTQKRPFKWDVTAAGNNFAGVFSTDMDQAQYDALMAKTFADHNKVQQGATVGSVDYGWTAPVGPPQVTLTITNPFTGQPANDHKVGSLQAFGLAAVNSGGPGMIRGRLTVSRVDGASIPQQSVGDGSDDALDTMQVMTEWGPAELSRAGDGKSVSLLWPPFDVPLAEDADLDEQAVGVLFRVPGEYHVHAEIIDAADYSISYGDTTLNYSVTQDLEVQVTGTNPTVYNGGAQPLGFSVTPASNPAVADMAAKIDLAYNGALAAPINAGTYSVDATSNDDDYVIAAPATQGYVIEQAPATVQWDALSFPYDGSVHTPIARIAEEPATSCVVTGTVGPDVGSYPVSASCNGINYEANEQGSAEVTPASATITLTHLRQAYDGAPKSVGVNTTPNGLPVTVTYDGSATPPSAVGSYVVQTDISDTNYVGSGSAVLEIVPGTSDIALVLNGPVDPVHVGETAQYAATMLANPALHDGQTFGYRITLAKTGGNHPLEEDDLATMQVFYQGMWVDAEDIFGTVPFFQQPDGTLLYVFPQGIPGLDNGFPIEDPSWTWNFRFGFADTGTYTTTAELVDGISHAPIAPAVQASFATVVQDALPPTDIKLVLGGPAGEVRAGEFAEYSTTMLADPSLHIGETFFVKITLNKSTGAMTAADLEQMQIHLGGSWVDGDDLGVTFTEEGGNLVYLFPESQFPGGFPIADDEWSWNFRFAFAEAAIYTATAEVIHAFEAGIANPDVLASAAIATTVVDPLTPPAPQMSMVLLGPVDDVQLGSPAIYTGSLLANPDDFAGREFFVRVRLSKNGGADAMTAADLAKMELHMGGWQDATDDLHPQLIVDGNELVYLFPQPFDAFQIDQQLWSWYFRFTYGDVGLYSALADVIDVADGDPLTAMPLASTEVSTQVVAPDADIGLQLQGPVAGIHVGEPAVYQGTLLADPLPDPSKLFFVEVRLSKSTGVMQMSDLEKMELHNGGVWEDATGQLPFTQDGDDLVYLFPKPFLDDGFPIDEPVWTWKFRFTYADAAAYTATARVLDAADMSQVSAPAAISTEIAPAVPNVSIQINGPVSGVQVGQPTAYIGQLTNHGADLPENAFVKVGVTHDGGPLVAGDVTTEVYFGGDWIEGTLVPDSSGGLEVDFPDSDGFPVYAGFEYTHQFRITYHKPGVFNAAATLVGANSDDVYATSGMATAVQPQDANVSMQLNGPVAGVEVDQPVAYIGQLINHGADLPENAFVKVGVTHDGGPLVAGDVTTEVYFGGDWIEGTLVPDGSGGLEVDFPDSDGFPVYAGFDYTHQFRITYHKPGVFNAAATLVGADSDDVYATSAMYTEVVPQSAVVAGIEIDPASLAVVYNGQPHSAVATTNPAGLPVTFSYDGNSSPPVDVGHYLVIATVSDGQFVGSTSAVMTISPAMATLDLSDTLHVYDGSAKAATVTSNPSGLAVAVTYGGSATPPTDAGTYAVFATVTDTNYIGSAVGQLVIAKAAVTLTLDGTTHVYDGTAKEVTVTTDPAGLAVDVTYDGSATAPTDAGSYAVHATVMDTNYSGSVVGQLVIAKAAVTLTLSDTTHAYDGTAKEVTVTTDPVGLAVDVTYDGSATTPTDAGSYAVLATVTGANFSGSIVGQLVIARAAVTLTLSDTTHVYDGTAREVTVTTDPVGLAVDVTYDGAATAPTDAGSYAVLATVTDANYRGSAVGQLVTAKAAVTLTLSDTTHVHDGSPKEVTVMTTPAGLDVDVTYDGSAIPPRAIGSYAVVATVNDSNHEGQISGLMSITAADATDLSVSISNDRDFVQYGKLMTWFVHVNNVGNTAVSGATVSSILPPELEDGLWSCMSVGTATCTSDGAGDLVDTVDIPAGGGVLYVLSARVVDDGQLSEVVNVDVNVFAAGDVEPGNDSATDTTIVVLFRDGFQKGDGAQDVDGADENPRHSVEGDAVLNLTMPHGLPTGYVSVLAQGHSGGASFRVEAIATPGALHVRLVVIQEGRETASRWSAAGGGDTLALGLLESAGQLLLVGASDDLELSTSNPND